VTVVCEWLDRFSVALYRANTCQESPPDVPSSARQQTPATSTNANYPDLPPFLDRRGEVRADAGKPGMEGPAL
jgi:hypothetical protein